MSESDDYRRDVAGRFSQATRNLTFKVMEKLLPGLPPEISETVMRTVEDHGSRSKASRSCDTGSGLTPTLSGWKRSGKARRGAASLS